MAICSLSAGLLGWRFQQPRQTDDIIGRSRHASRTRRNHQSGRNHQFRFVRRPSSGSVALDPSAERRHACANGGQFGGHVRPRGLGGPPARGDRLLPGLHHQRWAIPFPAPSGRWPFAPALLRAHAGSEHCPIRARVRGLGPRQSRPKRGASAGCPASLGWGDFPMPARCRVVACKATGSLRSKRT